MFSSRHMLLLARLTLVAGFFALLAASWQLFHRALDAEHLASWQLLWLIPLAVLTGWGKARFVMRKKMQSNALRLASSPGRLWPWQLYPPTLFAFIGSMILTMAILKRVYAHDGLVLGLLGAVDLAVAVALLTASREYRAR